jgi:hypothetical protein
MKRFIIIFLIILSSKLIAYPIRILSWDIKNDVKRLNSLNVSIDNVSISSQSIFADIRNESEAQLLYSSGFFFEKLPELLSVDNLFEINKQTESRDSTRSYYTLAEYNAFMIETAAQFPGICQLVQFGTSVQNRPLYFLKISDNVSLEEDEPEFRLVSSIHGNEVVGYDLLIRLIQLLTSSYGIDLRISNIIDNTELFICPMFNPDGYAAAQRYNANGADLNRNFPLPVGSQHPDGLSWQPETVAFMNHAATNNINLSINYHCGTLVVNYPWDYTYTLAPDNNLLIQAALTYSNHNSPMYNNPEFPQGITNGADWYVALGTLQDWSYAYTSGVDLTIEVSNENWPNSTQLDTFWLNNQESLLSLLEFVQLGIHGIVTDTSGNPLQAIVTFNGGGADTLTDQQVGDYHKVLLSGSYSVSAQAEGYSIDTATVNVPTGGSVVHSFVLEPLSYTVVSGKVINLSGAVVPNALGQLTYGSSTFDFHADSQGSFTVSNLPIGLINVFVSMPDYGILRSTLTVSAENNNFIFVLPTPLFTDDFENGTSSWNLQNPWAVVNFSNTHALADSPSGNYGNNLDTSATCINPISLINLIAPTLSFDIRYILETNYDFLYLQVSTNGITWTTIKEYTGSISNWQSEIIPLDDYSGADLYLRFRLVTDNTVISDGVYIDNVKVSGLSEEQTVYGDADSNWIIDFQDIQDIMEYSVGNDPIPDIDTIPWDNHRVEAADVDNDNLITATDAFYICSKLNLYNGSFPSQGGTAFDFENPNLNIVVNDINNLALTAQSSANLKSFTLDFSSSESLDINQITFNSSLENTLAAYSNDLKKLSFLPLHNAVMSDDLATIQFNSGSGVIQCIGTVNDSDFNLLLTSASEDTEIINAFKLVGTFPNPFTDITEIMFLTGKQITPVSWKIFNIKGQLIKSGVETQYKEGIHKIMFDARNDNGKSISSGIYFYELKAGQKILHGKMVMLK